MRRILGTALTLAMTLSMASVAFAKTAPVEVNGHIGDTRDRYHIAYNANGGTGGYNGPKLLTGETDTVCSLSQTGITHYGYSFTGWNRNADGSGTSYQPGDIITLNGNVTLYAQWKARMEKHPSKDSGGRTTPSNSDWMPWSDGTASPGDSVHPQNDGAAPASDGTATPSGNTAVSNSNTGDTSSMPLYVSLLCISLAVMIFLLWAMRREKRFDAQKP